MDNYFKIVVLIIFSSFIIDVLNGVIEYLILIYQEHYSEIHSSYVMISIKWIIISTLFWSLYIVIKKYGISILYKSKDHMFDIIALTFSIMAIYVINFSVMQLYLANESQKTYFGISSKNIPTKLKFLDEIEKSPIFTFILLYVVFAPFSKFIIRNSFFSAIWDTALIIWIFIVILNVVWGYDSLQSAFVPKFMNRIDLSESINLQNLFKILLLQDICFRGDNRFIYLATFYLENEVDKEEKGHFLNSIYCYSIYSLHNKLYSSKIKRLYTLLFEPLKFYFFEYSFSNLLSKTNISDWRYLPRILEEKYYFYNKLSKDTEIFKIFIQNWDNDNKFWTENSLSKILFPSKIVKSETNDLDYWNHLNRIFSQEGLKLYEAIIGKKLKFSNIEIYNKENTLKNNIEKNINNIITYQLKHIKPQTDYKYELFISGLYRSFENYSEDYLEHLIDDLNKILPFKEDGILICKETIQKEISINKKIKAKITNLN